ncbi:hypothetical protein H5410_031310 [Solanum commersonii]|uniref:Uncharacterized protein n=1 Tax=Solanum commersonii TaxID=4109 RepID=A0A9J5YLB8_SOLCO|nr:hypothetical protein H5410_031310 [Solanum commersonii]
MSVIIPNFEYRRATATRPLSSPIASTSRAKRQAPSSRRLLYSPLLSPFQLTNPAQPHPSLTPDPSPTGAVTTSRATILIGAPPRSAAITTGHSSSVWVAVAANSDSSYKQRVYTSKLTAVVTDLEGLEGIGLSRQAETLEGLQIGAMLDQIVKLTAALAESERKRVAEQQTMSETVQQIKEQVMNLARRPTTSAPDNTDDESDENDYVDLTP